MSDDGDFEEGEFDEEIPYENDDSSIEEVEKLDDSEDEIEDKLDEEFDELDELASIDLNKKSEDKKVIFKDTKKIKINPVIQKSTSTRTIIIVPEHEKRSDNRLQQSELSNILSMRSEQIAQHGTKFVDTDGITDVYQIAIKEVFSRKCPLKLRRTIGLGPNGEIIAEDWDINTMSLPPKLSV